jgi:ElaB/YqjD/DUF883 family membrane-anchored ribosome-binding protein
MTSTEQLEMETEQTRARLTDTLDELRAMSPGRMLDEVLDFAKDSGGEMLRGLGRQISENPMPTVLIAAGIAWMTMGKANGSSKSSTNGSTDGESRGLTDGVSDAANSTYQTGKDWGAKAGSAAQGAKETFQSAASGLSSAASAIGDKASSAYNAMSEKASRTASSMKSTASGIAGSTAAMEESAVAATRGLFDFCKDQPLVLAGLGLAIGAALGASIPETEAEDRLMGETADQMKDKAQQIASEQYQTAKDVGQHMVEETAKLAKQELTGAVDQMQDSLQQGQGNGGADRSQSGPLSGQPDLQQDERQTETNPGSDYIPTSDQRPIH